MSSDVASCDFTLCSQFNNENEIKENTVLYKMNTKKKCINNYASNKNMFTNGIPKFSYTSNQYNKLVK